MRLGQRLKMQLGQETEKERKKRVAKEKKEIERNENYFKQVRENKKEYKIEVLSTDIMKKLIFKESKEYFRKLRREFVVDENNKRFLHILSLYFSSNLEFENATNGELNKGILLYGPCGTGKSSIFDIIQIISRKYHLPYMWFKNISVHNVITEYNLEGEFVVTKYTKGQVHFDDLGTEKLANSWGVKEQLMARILEMRYNEFKAKGIKTFVTTNLTLEKLQFNYGQRVADRLYEMFNFIELGGDSRRF